MGGWCGLLLESGGGGGAKDELEAGGDVARPSFLLEEDARSEESALADPELGIRLPFMGLEGGVGVMVRWSRLRTLPSAPEIWLAMDPNFCTQHPHPIFPPSQIAC